MQCNYCQNKLRSSDIYCSKCGAKVNKEIVTVEEESTENIRSASIVLGIMSVVGASLFIFAPIALILGIVGLIFALKSNHHVKNTPGIVLNGIGLLLSFVITSIIVFFVCLCIDMIDDIKIPDYYHGDPVTSTQREQF